jgi:hypothetical protein
MKEPEPKIEPKKIEIKKPLIKLEAKPETSPAPVQIQ